MIGLITVVALFTGKAIQSEMQERQSERIMNDILTVATAAQRYYMDQGEWPNEADTTPCQNLFNTLNGSYFNEIDRNIDQDTSQQDTTFSCPSVGSQRPMLSIEWELPGLVFAEYMNTNIPMSSISSVSRDLGDGPIDLYRVTVGVPAPSISPSSTQIRRQEFRSGRSFNSGCGSLDEEILSISANGFCSDGIAIEGHSIAESGGDYTVYVRYDNGSWQESQASCNGENVNVSILYRCVVP